MTVALATDGAGKRFRRNWALRGASVRIPAGSVTGIIGPNGAGKSTLIGLAVGLLAPDAGSVELFGEGLVPTAEQIARVGFAAQRPALYPSLSIAEHLRFGAALNPDWDKALAEELIGRLGLERSRRAGRMSAGEQAQLGIVLAIAKRPELLVLDEPVANLDPLARRECLQMLMEYAAEHQATIVLSSHLIADVERVCDHLILLAAGEVRLTGEVDELLATHRRLTGPRRDEVQLPREQTVIEELHTDRQSSLLIHTDAPVIDPTWTVEEVGLEDVALAYMRAARHRSPEGVSR